MSKKTALLILILTSILLGSWLTYYFSDKEVIKRQLNGLAAQLSKEGQETSIQMGLKMAQVKNRLHNPCQVVIPERKYMQPLEQDLIIRYLMYYRQRYAQITLTFENISINIQHKGQAMIRAEVHLLRRTQTNQDELLSEVYPLDFSLAKQDKIWEIMQVTLPEAITE